MKPNQNDRQTQQKLLELYSTWHRTRRVDAQQKWLQALQQVLAKQPQFSIRQMFEQAF